MVRRREVRHLGALGCAVRTRRRAIGMPASCMCRAAVHYEHHLKHYGHPSDDGLHGDRSARGRAENLDPDALLDLYVKAGAKYFVALACHHDNFDTFNSNSITWNAVADRAQARHRRHLCQGRAGARLALRRFSNHSAHAWHWFQWLTATIPKGRARGVRYDAYRLTKAMGKGKWWEGLDPQELYGGPVISYAGRNHLHRGNERMARCP